MGYQDTAGRWHGAFKYLYEDQVDTIHYDEMITPTVVSSFSHTNQYNPSYVYAALYSTDTYYSAISFDNLFANVQLDVYLLLAAAIAIFVILYQMIP
jgi:hypothetical protein